MQDDTALSTRILQELAAAPLDDGLSLPRLGKRLGLGASVLMRELALMGDAAIGGVRGPGWARVERLDERWVAHITPAGRARLSAGPR
jgi:hypothetical protein